MTSTLPYSKGQIDRAGKMLLRALTGAEPLPSTDELKSATAVVEAFRRAHRTPMIGARMGLQSCIDTEELAVVELTQRLKRMPTVVDKLRRLPTMKLSSLQDLGGCRAVFATQAEVVRARQRFMSNSLRRNGTEDIVRDYVARPRDSGYRTLHLWTRYRGLRIEANCVHSYSIPGPRPLRISRRSRASTTRGRRAGGSPCVAAAALAVVRVCRGGRSTWWAVRVGTR